MIISPVIPVLTIQRLEHAVPLAEALVRGGLRSARGHAAHRVRAGGDPRHARRGARCDRRRRHADASARFQRLRGGRCAIWRIAGPDRRADRGGGQSRLSAVARHHDSGRADRGPRRRFHACKLFPAQQAGGVGMLKAWAVRFRITCSAPPAAYRAAMHRNTWICRTCCVSAARGLRRPRPWPPATGRRSSRWRAMRPCCVPAGPEAAESALFLPTAR
jgi:2-dehydro-3-deoxyphosphogluconate aldolase/(4S)-4-hydroxy-2-oxoglutarate aldolase